MLSNDTQKKLRAALASKGLHGFAEEIIAAINSGGNPVAAHVANVTTADASDLPTAEALANANKVAINAILSSLQAAGIMASS